MRIGDQVDEATRLLRVDMDDEVSSLLGVSSTAEYRRYLGRAYSFVSPLERVLLDTTGLVKFFDTRRFHKHNLIEHDLQALGLKLIEIQSLPQCMWIPWFEDVHSALGWAYVMERNTIAFPEVFRRLASVLPGEAAFSASYLKCYSGAATEMWKSFLDGIESSITKPDDVESIIAGAIAGCRSFRRWRNTLDGKSLSGPQPQPATGEPTSALLEATAHEDPNQSAPEES